MTLIYKRVKYKHIIHIKYFATNALISHVFCSYLSLTFHIWLSRYIYLPSIRNPPKRLLHSRFPVVTFHVSYLWYNLILLHPTRRLGNRDWVSCTRDGHTFLFSSLCQTACDKEDEVCRWPASTVAGQHRLELHLHIHTVHSNVVRAHRISTLPAMTVCRFSCQISHNPSARSHDWWEINWKGFGSAI